MDSIEYHRSYLPIAQLSGPVTEDLADRMLGHEIEVDLHGVVVAAGTITDVCISGTGRLMAVVESGGRMCTLCRHIYDEQTELTQLRRAMPRDTPPTEADLAAEQHIQPWSPVCHDWKACRQRVIDNTGGGGKANP